MRLDIRYRTVFDYDDEVTRSHTHLRAVPTNDDRQRVHHQRVSVSPETRVVSWIDYWGTHVDAFGVSRPHDRLEVVCDATVATRPADLPMGLVRREALSHPAFVDRHTEFLGPSPHIEWSSDVDAIAEDVAATVGDDVTSLVTAAQRMLGDRFEYAPGATSVDTTVDEAFAQGAGVCQDYAHCLIAMCRSLGVPARYVSGYFYAASDADGRVPEGAEVDVETHAWVEVALPGFGWWALDPTNQQRVDERHVVIGRGRDYGDVAPLRGSFSGGSTHASQVSVRLRVLAEQQQQQ